MYMWDEKSGLAARKGVASTTSHEISHQYASPSFLRASPVESSFFSSSTLLQVVRVRGIRST